MDLQPACDRYAELLGLTTWRFRARYALPGEIRDGNVGQLNWQRDLGKCSAEILVDPGLSHDHEITVAHELCHVPLLGCQPKGVRAAHAQEQAIDRFACALVKQYRRKHA